MFVITFIQICVRQIRIDKQCVRYRQFIKHVNAIKPVFNCTIRHTRTVGLPYRAINTDHIYNRYSVALLRFHGICCYVYTDMYERHTQRFSACGRCCGVFCFISIRLFVDTACTVCGATSMKRSSVRSSVLPSVCPVDR